MKKCQQNRATRTPVVETHAVKIPRKRARRGSDLSGTVIVLPLPEERRAISRMMSGYLTTMVPNVMIRKGKRMVRDKDTDTSTTYIRPTVRTYRLGDLS